MRNSSKSTSIYTCTNAYSVLPVVVGATCTIVWVLSTSELLSTTVTVAIESTDEVSATKRVTEVFVALCLAMNAYLW